MNNRTKWLVVLFAGLLVGAGAGLVAEHAFQNNASIQVVGDIDVYVDGVLNPTGVDWGVMEPGYTYYVNLTVVNKANTNVTVTLTTTDLPEGWVHSWTLNNTVWTVNESKGADLDLTVSPNAAAGNYVWTATVTATEP